jgi:D-glycero-D-manno-heptose 1,7-bisphosphate phosphatase
MPNGQSSWAIGSVVALEEKITAVFVDRDGVLNTHMPDDYVKCVDELTTLPGIARAIGRLNDAGLPVIVISNQQGVGKGLMTMADLEALQSHMVDHLLAEAGAWIDAWYYCTDLKSDNSFRRKPKPGMLIEAAEDFKIEIGRAVFIGDSPTDIAAGAAAGVAKTILVLSGGIHSYSEGDMWPAPDLVLNDLPSAVEWILENNR